MWVSGRSLGGSTPSDASTGTCSEAGLVGAMVNNGDVMEI